MKKKKYKYKTSNHIEHLIERNKQLFRIPKNLCVFRYRVKIPDKRANQPRVRDVLETPTKQTNAKS